MALSSADCRAKIAEFKTIKTELLGIIDGIDGYISEFSGISTYLEDLIVNGEPIDKEQLSNMSVSLEKIKGNFQSVVKECEQRIQEYTNLFYEALAREREAKRNSLRR